MTQYSILLIDTFQDKKDPVWVPTEQNARMCVARLYYRHLFIHKNIYLT